MKKFLSVMVIIFFLSACSTTYKPVASLEEIATKEEVEQSRNWIEPNSDAKQASAFASGFLGGIIIGLPLAMALASIPDEKGLSMPELADKVAAKTCDKTSKFIYYTNNLSDDLGIFGVKKMDQDDMGLRSVGLMYVSKRNDNRLLYTEVRMVKKIDDSTYWSWRIPLLKKTDEGNFAFVLNNKLRLDGPVMAKGGSENMFEFTFIDELSGGAKIVKGEKDLLHDIKVFFMDNSFEMETLKCAQGDKVCGRKNVPASEGAKADPSAAIEVN